MADAMDTIKNVMSSLNSGGNGGGAPDMSGESLEYINQMKSLINQLGSSHDDPRSNLLMSLKPYMRSNRQRSIDSAVRMLNMTKLVRLFRQ